MCGIAGFVDFDGRPAGDLWPALERMHRALDHRGPDGWGRVLLEGAATREVSPRGEVVRDRAKPGGPTVGFVHSRLAIIDLSLGGHQPMVAAGGATWVTFNGEIYNYQALRQALVQRGLHPRTTSDTEALVELLDRDGAEALAGLRGMFAFAAWDERSRRLLLARDRFGIKPLVYAQPSAGVVLFASEPRALAACGLIALDLEPGGVADFLARGAVDVSLSGWAGVQAVAPGECLSIDAAGVTRQTYWSLDRALLDQSPDAPVEAVAHAAHRAIVSSVEAHLVSDVQVAIFLSSGIDSTAILAAAREVTAGALHTFTVSMPGSRLDEAASAKGIARRFASEHVEVSIEDVDMDTALDEFFRAMQRPSVDGFNTFLVARAARQAGVRVALSGVGGDELFGGYESFVGVPRLARTLAALGPLARWPAPLLKRGISPRVIKLGAILESAPRTVAEVWWEYRRLFADDDVATLAGRHPSTMPVARGGDAAAAFDLIRYLEFRHFLEPQLLADADAFTMCHALELRTPLVDHVVADEVVRAGRWRRSSGASFKQTLFAAMPALTMPGGVSRPKQGFVLPYDAWFREALSAPSPTRWRDLASRLRKPRYQPFVERFLDRRLHWSRLWAIYVLDRFADEVV